MKIQSFLVRASLSFLLAFLTFSGVQVAAQTQANTASAAQAAPAVPARITQAIDDTQLVTLKGNVQVQARPEFDKGPVSDAQPMKRMMLLLRRSPEQQAALTQLMAGQLSKESPSFHQWLTPVQFGQQFGPADADIQTVTDWLTRQGFQGIKVANGRTVIEFSGNVAQVRNTFHTEIHNFEVNGKTYSANVSDPQIPVALSPVVAGIVSLHNFPRKSFRHDAGIHAITRDSKGTPQFTTPTGCGTGGAQQCFFVGPADFAKIYNVPAALDGTGVTIGIVGDSNIDPNDAVGFRTVFGLSPTTGPTIIVDGPDPGISGPGGDEGEGDLDVQISGMVAPKATIKFVVAESTLTALGTDIASFRLIDDNLADVISESFGQCELGISNSQGSLGLYSAIWEQAAAQGTSVMVSAGDNGSAACDDFHTEAVATGGLAVNGVASTPFNVAVGGTDFDDVGSQLTFFNATNAAGTLESAKGYIKEMTWNDSCAAAATSANLNTICASATNIVGGSGGPSGNASVLGISKPAFQNGLTPADGVRDLPDVSLFASDGPQSHSFYPVCEADAAGGQPSCTGANFVIGGAGGTSASSPAFAGIMALINQQQHGRQGNPNVVLYQIAATAPNGTAACNSSTQPLTGSATCAFYDITKGNNSVPCAGTSTNCSSNSANTNGVLVDPANPTTPAWTTKTGYDFATGLGSVNVTNLAAQWGTAVGAFKGTTSSLTLNGGTTTVTTTHGTPVNVVATVAVNAPNSGTPTGDVSLLGGAAGNINSGTDFNTLNGGSPDTATFATPFLPGGSYSVTLHYTGDGTFAPSDSNAVPVVITKENSGLVYEIAVFDPTTGNLTAVSPVSYPFGSLTELRMDILNSGRGVPAQCQIFINGGNTAGCAIDATGTVTITDNASPLTGSPFTVNAAGSVEDQTLQLTTGAHTLSGTYSGDVSYNPLTVPVVVTTTVTKAPTTAAVLANPTTVATGATVMLSATVSTNSVSTTGPGGTVTFSSNGTAIGSPVTVTTSGAAQPNFAGATATLSTSFGTAGTKSITATYNGDTNYAASAASPAATVTVTGTAATPTITTLMPNSATAGGAAFTLTVNGTNFAAGATVNFGANTPVTTFVSATQLTAAITAPEIATAGPIAVTVTNPGGGGTSNSVNFTVTAAAAPTITTLMPNSATAGGAAFTLTVNGTNFVSGAAVHFGANTPVTTFVSATQVTAAITAPEIATAGPIAVTVTNPGGGGTSNSVNFTVTAALAPTITPPLLPASATAGGAAFTLTVNGTNFVTGATVNFGANTPVTTFVSATQLTAAITAPEIATAGPIAVTVTNPSGGGTSNSVNFTVTPAPSFTVTSTPVTLSSATGASVNSTITVTSSGGFNSAVTIVCPTTLPAGFTCTAPAAITPPANGSNTGMLALAVTATSSTLTAANTPQDRMLEANATPSAGGKGWWTLSAGTGFAALFLMFLPGGRKKYRAALGLGLVCILSLTMGCSGMKTTIVKVATVTKLTVPSAKAPSGTAFTFSVAVTGGTPGGMVQLFDGATMIGTAATVTGGVATPTAPALTVGTHAITAHYLGDANTMTSQSGTINMTVTGNTTVAITTNPVATPAASPVTVTVN
jgi:hypothetical protein